MQERGAGSAYLRLGPASTLPAPALSVQPRPWAPGTARRPPPPSASRAPARTSHSHLHVRARRAGRAVFTEGVVPGRARLQGRRQGRADWRELAAAG